MPYQLKVNQSIVRNISELEWEDEVERSFTFIDFTCDTFFEIGSLFELKDRETDTLVFCGIITKMEQTSPGIYKYLGYDYGFYFEKNETTIQFKETNISQAFGDLCRKYNVYSGFIPKIDATVTKKYEDTKIADIFRDLLFIARVKTNVDDYYIDCRDGKFNIFQFTDRSDLVGYLSDVLAIKCTDTIFDIKITKSMMDMKNKVNIIDDTGKIRNFIPKENSEYVKKYGLLECKEKIDYGTDKDYLKLANNRLKQLSTISNEITINMLGDYQMKKGIVIPIKSKELNLNDKYLIQSSNHMVRGNQETVNVNIRLIKDEDRIKPETT